MSVRHVHAKSNEYIAVHRGRTYHIPFMIPNGNAILYVIGGILLLAFWKAILTLAVAGIVFYLSTKYVWIYRSQIWNGFLWLENTFRNTLISSCSTVKRWLASKKACHQTPAQSTSPSLLHTGSNRNTFRSSANHGKIIQRH